MRTPHRGTLWGELSPYFGKEMGGAGENAGTGDKSPTIRQHSGNSAAQRDRIHRGASNCLRALFCSGFLGNADFAKPIWDTSERSSNIAVIRQGKTKASQITR